MIINLAEDIKYGDFFSTIDKEGVAVFTDSSDGFGEGKELKHLKVFRLGDLCDIVGTIVALNEKFERLYVVLDKINYDSIYRIFKNKLNNVCIINLNSGFSGVGRKITGLDLDDVYFRDNLNIYEPVDKKHFETLNEGFLNEGGIVYIRVPFKDIEKQIGGGETYIEYNTILNLSEFGYKGNMGTILVYGALLQETVNTLGRLQNDGKFFDCFWLGNFLQPISSEILVSLANQEKLIIIGDMDINTGYRNFLYSQLFSTGVGDVDIDRILPKNFTLVNYDDLIEHVGMNGAMMYERINKLI